ncbi:hypothetical protein CC78DRAFT_611910 [Lojkania enalia]|uniref:Uncharacterized protein n=1 Tax=Lojkania enalia TaxID=147567 RepID=A0A9P4NBP9_9PLEO|nr:hypothetical protein CC78DRAFT_611910 [Didymosphaeria enalia]
MKYIILYSLFSSAAFAVPLAQEQAAGNTNANAATASSQTQSQVAQGQVAQGQVAQGQAIQQQGAAAVDVQQAGTANTGNAGQVNGQLENSPQAGVSAQGTPSAADLATAVSNWQADTSMVSNFLDTGGSIMNNVAFKQAATVALNAEIDELNHKAIIDSALANDPNVQAANSTLEGGGAFQDVVDRLQIMSQQGRAAVENIDLINQNRCVNVLPNIDAYMAATGSTSQAIRPQVCDQTGVAGGVQGTGPTLQGQVPGTPQVAFDAAQGLAAGTGNGLVQNGAGAVAATPSTAEIQAGVVPAAASAIPAAGTAIQATPSDLAQAGQQVGQQAAQQQAGQQPEQVANAQQIDQAAQGQQTDQTA